MPDLTELTVRAPVTVVIPHHNQPTLVQRALSSVEAQTQPPEQVFIVDDASDKPHRLALSRIAESATLPLDVLWLPTNLGPAAARNIGWQKAKTQYIAFLDSDDLWSSNKLAVQLSLMRQYPDALMSAHAIGSAETRSTRRHAHTTRITLHNLLFRNPIPTSSVLLYRCVQPRFPPNRRYAEDHLLWCVLAATSPIILTDAVLGCHHRTSTHSGLSANLLAMERGELTNFVLLRRDGQITFTEQLLASGWSILKFVRRLLLRIWRRAVPLGAR